MSYVNDFNLALRLKSTKLNDFFFKKIQSYFVFKIISNNFAFYVKTARVFTFLAGKRVLFYS